MGYDDLGARGDELKELAIDKYVLMHEGEQNTTPSYPGVPSYPGSDGQSNNPSIDHRAAAERRYADAHEIFDDWIGLPEPGDFTGPINAINRVMVKISVNGYTEGSEGGQGDSGGASTVLTDIGPTGAYMQDWNGEAAFRYGKYYAGRFAPTASNQFGIAAGLKTVLQAEQALWEAAREDIAKIADDAIAKLESITSDGGGSGWSTTFTVIGAVIGVAGTVATGGTGAAIAWATAGAASSLLPGMLEDTEREYPAGSPDEIISSARQAMQDLNTDITDLENHLITALRSDASEIRDLIPGPGTDLDDAAKWRLCLPRPKAVTTKGMGNHT